MYNELQRRCNLALFNICKNSILQKLNDFKDSFDIREQGTEKSPNKWRKTLQNPIIFFSKNKRKPFPDELKILII